MRLEEVVLAERCHFFAKGGVSTEFADGLLSQEGLVEGRSCEQIICKSAAAEGGSRSTQQLEERAFTQDVQISGVDVIGIAEFFAFKCRASPISIDSLNGAIVEALESPHARLALASPLETPERGGGEGNRQRGPQKRKLPANGVKAKG